MSYRPGDRLGPYEVVAPLGAGGMGEVYRARDPRLDRQVAVKVLGSWMAGEADLRLRFEREARAAARLNHPNLVAIFDVGEHQGTPYLVTELLPGETLQQILRRGPLSLARCLDLALQLASGLGSAHDAGVVHRDLKPANLMVLPGDRLKILDFGLARLAPGGESPAELSLTGEGALLGTLGYVSPEVLEGRKADARSDVFAAGAVLYEMLSGRGAFRRASPAETLAAVSHEEPPPVTTPGAGLAAGLLGIVRRCLRKRPAERFDSGGELRAELERLAGQVPAVDPSLAVAGPAASPSILPATSEDPTRQLDSPSVAVLPFVAPAQAGTRSISATGSPRS